MLTILFRSQLQAALQELNVEREEKSRAMKAAQSLKDACAQAIERQHAAEERLSATLEETKQSKIHSDMLVQCYKVCKNEILHKIKTLP